MIKNRLPYIKPEFLLEEFDCEYLLAESPGANGPDMPIDDIYPF